MMKARKNKNSKGNNNDRIHKTILWKDCVGNKNIFAWL